MSQSSVPPHLRIDSQSIADPGSIVLALHARFTVLTPRLLRLECSFNERFEDRASQAFWYRRQPVPDFQVLRDQDRVEIITQALHLRYQATPRGFTRRTLSIESRETGTIWRFGDRDWHNLRGTARTLDEAHGPVHLEPGLMSRAGWALVDDSATLVFGHDGWLEPRNNPGAMDLYFFGYGHDYLPCLQDFCRLAGPMPLIPRWMLGNWWSRYWAYSQAELQGLVEAFQAHQIPLSVCIVDMDWHLTDVSDLGYDSGSSGWTGYTWNRELFPDPVSFIAWLHEQGLRTALNLHPAEGIHPHEEAYPQMAKRLGIDPASQEPISFDLADPAFAAAYFELLHHPLEAQGVDFWWIDWQQGTLTKLPGLDPLWWLNHLHYLDLGRANPQLGQPQSVGAPVTPSPDHQSTALPTYQSTRRPVIFSRWGGLGNHRYPIGFSGDTVVSWESLAFQPYFTATAANVGYGWWSHDIGGHMGGIEDRELYVRWVQYGVFSPILRLHSTKNPYHERRPWGWDAQVLGITRDAMQLRHAIIPYLYAMAWRSHVDSVPLCLPMYYRHPQAGEAYACPGQYYFGSELVAAPFTGPADPQLGLSRQVVWLPPGDWFHFFSGESYAGDGWHTIYGELEDIPVFARAGAIVPMQPRVAWGGIESPEELVLVVFPGADNVFELYEDDGESQAYQQGATCITPCEQRWQGDALSLTIGPVQGDVSLIPTRRTYTVVFRGIRLSGDVVAEVNGIPQQLALAYDEDTETLTLSGIAIDPSDQLNVTLSTQAKTLLSRRDRRLAACRKLLRAFRLDSLVKQEIDGALPDLLAGGVDLMHYAGRLTAGQLQALQDVLDHADPSGFSLHTT